MFLTVTIVLLGTTEKVLRAVKREAAAVNIVCERKREIVRQGGLVIAIEWVNNVDVVLLLAKPEEWWVTTVST